MRCERALPYLDAHVDGELRGWRRFALDRHVRACPACAARQHEALSLSARIRTEAPRFTAPLELRAKLMALAERSTAPPAVRRRFDERWPWLGAGAAAGAAVTIVAWLASQAVLNERANADMALAVVNTHVQATLASHLVQVASSDQHTVKPWLSARLDYSPPVRDLAAQGFPLAGARIESVQGHPVAILVYRYRQHFVDVFVRPDWMQPHLDQQRTIRGFNVVAAHGKGMDWLAVSDANTDALRTLLGALLEPERGSAR